ncbi:MAG: hypothetical protein ACFB10_23710 [Salibacteraceae bacterium]
MEDVSGFYLFTLLVPAGLAWGCVSLYKSKNQWGAKNKGFIITWNLALTLTLLTALFAIGETWYRFVLDTTDSFGLNKITTRWMHRHFQPNGQGFRDNQDWEMARTPGKRRITFIGDSFTAGHGVESVDDRFANRIRKAHPEWEIHIMGNNGLETEDVGYLIERFALDYAYEFEELVYVYNINDIATLLPQTKVLYDKMERLQADMGFWARQSYLINTWYYRLSASQIPEIKSYYDYVLSAYSGETWKRQVQQLLEVQNYCQRQRIRLKVVLFPFLHEQKDPTAYAGIHQQLLTYWQQADVPCLDLLPVFEPHQGEDLKVNAYDAHPNEQAHAIAAEAIDTFLEKN